jgi:hypothetical protein
MYKITTYTKDRAKQAGLEVKPSTKPNKKLDVYHQGQYIASVGDSRYSDYPTYLQQEGKEVAEERRRLYHLRHNRGTLRERLASWLLWWKFF